MHLPSAWRLGLTLLLGVIAESLQAAGHVAPPNILWHNKATGATRVWIMDGITFASEVALPSTADDVAWKPGGTGDLNRDGEPDVVWHNERTGQNAVWYMKGTGVVSNALIQAAADLDWSLVGVADFSGDGKPDLLWQRVTDGASEIWIMNGHQFVSRKALPSAGDPNWRMVATGDMDRDGNPDIVLRNRKTGQNAVWLMKKLEMSAGHPVKTPQGAEAAEKDPDWHIVATADLNGDRKPDLVWRHVTLGLNVSWFMDSNVIIGSSFLSKQEFDGAWKACGQETADSDARLRTASFNWLRAKVSSSPPEVRLSFALPKAPGFGATVQRRLWTETNWTKLASGHMGDGYTDSKLTLGQSYEYRVFREGFGGFQSSGAEHFSVAMNAAPIEERGRVLLLVDQTLANELSADLLQLREDLVGDGWSVLRHDVPRHIDDYSSATSFRTNAYNITNVIKPLIRAAVKEDAATKVVLLVGHVSIPYSGSFNPDGHNCGPPPFGPDHRGAWPGDMYYGDLDGKWTDSTVNHTNCYFAASHNFPDDGKFDQDSVPAPGLLKLAVGRIDFARMPVFTAQPPPGIAPKSEASLLRQYLQKDHLYRFRQLSWQQGALPNQVMVYGHFHDGRDDQILENAALAARALSDETNNVIVGDFCLRRVQPVVWGFLSGAGGSDRVNNGIPHLEHTAADLANPANEPKAAFYTVLASYIGDWNLVTNNYLRGLLATPNYGLASMWTRMSLWRTDALGVGEHLGACQVRMVNDPKNGFHDRSRELAILGDPALRLHILRPPGQLTATASPNAVGLSWTNAESGAQFQIYRGASRLGPFKRLSPEPVAGNNYTDNSPVTNEQTYMVRTLKPVTVGTGTYTNISQGVFVNVD